MRTNTELHKQQNPRCSKRNTGGFMRLPHGTHYK
nr:MAG TPA: hypothetical protein [Caudoviricetes sp.]